MMAPVLAWVSSFTQTRVFTPSKSDTWYIPVSRSPIVATESDDANSKSQSTIAPAQTPLLDALICERDRVRANFFCPCHKQGATVHPDLKCLVGEQALAADLPELPALGDLFESEGVLNEAQQFAADAFTQGGRARWRTHFLINGTTCGVEAAILSCVRPDRSIVLPRTVHQSAIHALVLSGAVPIWINSEYDAQLDLTHCVTVESVWLALERHGDDVDAVFIVSPTYHGVLSDVEAIARVTHEHGACLIVDEAHGAHLEFHPQLPRSATSLGADIVLHSVHKTLPALTQAAIMHVRRNGLVDTGRVRSALRLVQSSSPNYLLLASLDAARALMQTEGYLLMARTLALAHECTQRIASLKGFSVFGAATKVKDGEDRQSRQGGNPPIYAHDATRITVLLPPHVSGYDIDTFLIDRFGVYPEFPSFRHITFILTPGTTKEDIDKLIASLTHYSANIQSAVPFSSGFHLDLPNFIATDYTMRMTPRQAFFAKSLTVPSEHAVGQVCAETLCPYPPGIPILLPGEIITQHGIQFLKAVLNAGGCVSGTEDDTLSTIRVIDEDVMSKKK